MLPEPGSDLGMFVRGVVVGDQVHVEMLRRLAVDGAQELEPFLMPVPLHALADHAAGGDVESCERRRRAMAFVVVLVWTATDGIDVPG